MKIRVNDEWAALMRQYADDHQNPINQACHRVGIPLVAGSVPTALTVVGLPVATAMWTTGWAFQFVGHAFEGKKPSFTRDPRNLFVGVLWWLEKSGVRVERPA